MKFDKFSPQQWRDGIEVEMITNIDTVIAAEIARIKLEKDPFYYDSMQKARPTKYISKKKVKGKWEYTYADKKGVKTNSVDEEEKPKKMNWLEKIGNLFGLSNYGQISQKIEVDYKENKIEEKFKISFKSWKDHLAEYFNNKEKWDNLFSGKKSDEKKPKKDKKEKKKPKTKETKKSGLKLSVMKELFKLYGGFEQRQENNFDTMPDGEVDETSIMSSKEKTMTEEQYLSLKRASRQEYGDVALAKKRRGQSDEVWNKIVEAQRKKDEELSKKRKELKKEYKEKLDSGEIKKPTIEEEALDIAQGNPDNLQVQASRRVLEKMGIDWKTGKKIGDKKAVISSDKSIQEKLKESIVENKENNEKPAKYKGTKKDEFVRFIKNQLNIDLKNEKNDSLNKKRDRLYTEIPQDAGDRARFLSLLSEYKIPIEDHIRSKGLVWIPLKDKNTMDKIVESNRKQEESEKSNENNFDTMPEQDKKPIVVETANGSKIELNLQTTKEDAVNVAADDITDSRDGYFNEKPSEILNVGKDVFGARRHNFDTYASMNVDVSQLEKDGVAQAYVTRKNLIGDYGLSDKEDRIAQGETDYKVLASFCVKDTLLKVPGNSEKLRSNYMNFCRSLTRLDDNSKDAKTFLLGLAEQIDKIFPNNLDKTEIAATIGKPLYVFLDILSEYNQTGETSKSMKLFYGLDKNERKQYTNLRKVLESELDIQKKTYDELRVDILGATKASGVKVKKGDSFIFSDEFKDQIYTTSFSFASDEDKKLVEQARSNISKYYGLSIPYNFDELSDMKKQDAVAKNANILGETFKTSKEFNSLMKNYYENNVNIIKEKTIKNKLYPEKSGEVVKAGKKKITVSFEFADGRIRTFDVNPMMIKQENVDQLKKEKQSGGKLKPNLYVESKVIREGGKSFDNITTAESQKMLNEQFKTKSLQYGNSMTDEERAYHTKWTLEAFSDLSEVLDLPLDQITVNGKLGMAFGARGKAGALAHYEPDTKMINLTRGNGFGSLAHEWGHFLDNILSDDMGTFISETPTYEEKTVTKETIKHGSIVETRGRRRGTTDRYYYDAEAENKDYSFVKLNKGENSPSTKPSYVKFYAFNSGQEMKVLEPSGKPFMNQARDIASKAQKLFLDKARETADSLEPGKREKFIKTFISSNYYKQPVECWARSFESYVADKLEENGRKNTYLSSKAKTNKHDGQFLYPQGQDRIEINNMFDNFFSMIRGSEDLKKAISKYIKLKNKIFRRK